ncbi:MAG TPA: DUF5020 family protein [Bacteroidales bacterium]|nr:DUF5020 family protein [Bacteroidales bacterium]
MKKYFLLALLLLPMVLKAQNIQLHYDMGKDRGYFTSTVEMFKPDNWGNTFFFIDMDYNVGDVEGVSLAYFEIARCLKLGKSPFSLHAEFNGGFGRYNIAGQDFGYPINNAWLGGLDYSWNNADFSKGFSLKALYKTIRHKNDASFQITGVWHANFLKNKITFSGFADFWKEDNVINGEKKDFVFLSEPQLWFNATKNLSVGSEVELSSNFAGMDGFNVMPTVAAKWTF